MKQSHRTWQKSSPLERRNTTGFSSWGEFKLGSTPKKWMVIVNSYQLRSYSIDQSWVWFWARAIATNSSLEGHVPVDFDGFHGAKTINCTARDASASSWSPASPRKRPKSLWRVGEVDLVVEPCAKVQNVQRETTCRKSRNVAILSNQIISFQSTKLFIASDSHSCGFHLAPNSICSRTVSPGVSSFSWRAVFARCTSLA